MTQPVAKPAWVQLYEARKAAKDTVEMRSPGRPSALIPRKKVGLTLSQGEITEIETWQQRLSELMGRKISTGETVGILVRISTARFSHVSDIHSVDTLEDLVEWMTANQ